MKRMILGTALTLASILFAGQRALAQRQEGWPMDGELNWSSSQQTAPLVRKEIVIVGTDSRYIYHNNRWWYWTPENKLLVWNDGQWQDYSTAKGLISFAADDLGSIKASDANGWYRSDSDKRWYFFDGKTLQRVP